MSTQRSFQRVLFPWLEGAIGLVILTAMIIALSWQLGSGPRYGRVYEAPLQGVGLAPVPLPSPSSFAKALLPGQDHRVLWADARGVIRVPEMVTLADVLNTGTETAEEDLDILHVLLDSFLKSAAWTGAPAAENVEFTALLRGENPHRLAFISPDHASLNDKGELLDRWGMPYHFHVEGAGLPQIRSAGADKKLFTPDDVLTGGEE